MKSLIFKTLSLILLIHSCTGKEIQYTGINIPLKKEMKGTPLNTTFIFSNPEEVLIIDSLLIIRDSHNQDSCFHIFNKENGKHLRSFGYKGRGPGEVLYPSALHYNPLDQTVTTIEPNLKKIIRYNIINILSHKKPFFSEIELPYFALEAIPYKDSFIIGGLLKERFVIADTNNRILQQYYEYPQLVRDSAENRAIFNYAPQYAIHPDQNKLAAITYIGGILEIFDIKDNKITPNTIKHLNEPIYRPVEDCQPKWIATVPQTVAGCSNIYPAKEYIYCIYEGELSEDPLIAPKKVLVFDWKGHLLLQYEFKDGIPNTISADEKYLYSIITTPEGEYQLYRYRY